MIPTRTTYHCSKRQEGKMYKVKMQIIRTSSRESQNFLRQRGAELELAGFEPTEDIICADPDWKFTAGSVSDRLNSLIRALEDPKTTVVQCARGGYGASDLLPLIPWARLKKLPPKLIVGFSDVSALHGAFYKKLGWLALHAPMPATELWGLNGQADVAKSLELMAGKVLGHEITIDSIEKARSSLKTKSLSGTLFGGCLSVLTNLIGTPYLPKSFKDHILFFEDTGENPGRIMRMWNQWEQAGLFKGVRAIVLGHFRDLGESPLSDMNALVRELHRRFPRIPIFLSQDFGHKSPNEPLGIGSKAVIKDGKLTWKWRYNFGPKKPLKIKKRKKS